MTDTYTHSSEIVVDVPVLSEDKRPEPPAGWKRHETRGDYSAEPWIAHGTMKGYSYHNCSCEPCRKCNRRSQLYFVLRKRERDGLPAPAPTRQSPRASTTRSAELCIDLVMAYAPDLYVNVIGEAENYDEGARQLVEMVREETPDVWAEIEHHATWERNYPPRPLAPPAVDSREPAIPMWPDAAKLLGMTRERVLEAVQRRELPIVLVDGELAVLAREVLSRLHRVIAETTTAEPEQHSGHEHVDSLRGSQLALDDDDVQAIAVPLWPDAGRQLGLSRSATYQRAADGALLVCEIEGKRMVTLAEIERQRAAS